jgi:hypothetical protein
MPIRVVSPTTRFSKAFVARAWSERAQLSESERRGLGHFVYVGICGHVEATIMHLMEFRLMYVRAAVRDDKLPRWRDEINGRRVEFDSKPLANSLFGLISSAQKEIASAPLNKLIDTFPKVFGVTFKEVVGSGLAADIEALGSVRNIIAHGRNLIVDFRDSDLPGESMLGSIDRNPMQKPLARLKHARLISSTKITGANHSDVLEKVFSEKAIRYFYNAVRSTEKKLVDALKFPPCPEAMCPDILDLLPD